MDDQFKGNKNSTSAFLEVLMALKENINKDLNVAEIGRVIDINQDKIKVQLINNDQQKLVCYQLRDLQLENGDYVLIIFTNSDFRSNLTKIKNNKLPQNIDERSFHTTNYGVIVGIIYKEE